MRLISRGESNPKTAKSAEYGYLTGGLHLAPHISSGYQVCASASPGCSSKESGCLFYQGRGRMTMVQQARIRKTRLYFERREEFLADLVRTLHLLKGERLKTI